VDIVEAMVVLFRACGMPAIAGNFFPPGLLLYKIDCNISLLVVAHKCKEDQRISRNLGFAMMISIL